MPNRQHYADSSATFPQSHHGFPSNPMKASAGAGPSDLPPHCHCSQREHPAFNQHEQSYQSNTVYSSYTRPDVHAAHPQLGYAHQPSQMPGAPADSRYAPHYEPPLPRDQPPFQQTRYPQPYPQYGYPAGNMQSAYATSYPPGGSGGYPQPGSTELSATRQQGYVNDTYPPPGIHSSHVQYPPEVRNNDQTSAVVDRPAARSRDNARSHSHGQQFGVARNTGPETEHAGNPSSRPAARQQPADTEQHHVWSAESTSHQSKSHDSSNVANHRQSSQQKSPHIVKQAVLHPAPAGKLLCLQLLTMISEIEYINHTCCTHCM